MSESNRRKSLEESKSGIPSNEDIVDELVKGIGNISAGNPESDQNNEQYKKSPVNDDVPEASNDLNSFENIGDDGKTEVTARDDESDEEFPDDVIDEDKLKKLDEDSTEDERKSRKAEAEKLKVYGNEQFKTGEFEEAASSYTKALNVCPLASSQFRSVLYANRAAARMSQDLNKQAIKDCSKAIELDQSYVRAYLRRAKLYENTDKLDEALADYNKVLETDPLHREAILASKKLTESINERNEKLKTEMMGKLKDLGNMILRPFGLSTNNFQMVQDPNTGGYSVNFNQNASPS
ncbi:tetratricopeptide repeat protein 1 [Nilaparvata lugens]|uniref:tetratricopeptide repeat protein 1 n=1 Tax=Nilaparvata lugens TaxID=108931 RepID=UPI000B987803|nr:tetratricopeptide repeat protein 1 [Nilaparvata lugens]